MAIFCQTINVNTKHTRQVHIPRYHSISVVASLGTKGPSKFNDSKIFLLWLFQWNTGIMLTIRTIPIFCCNHSNEILESFCKGPTIQITQLRWVYKITRKSLQNDFSISLEWWLQQKIILIISMIPVFHWNNENKKIFKSSNLLWP